MASFERGIFVKRTGAWEEILIPSVKYDSAWHDITAGYVKHNGKWQQFYPSSGITYWICPLSYTWKVPAGIHEITVNLAAGGGGGGGGTAFGPGSGGGGGGSSGYLVERTMKVKPRETIKIQIGGGGPGAAIIGETSQAPSGGTGASTTISGSLGSLTAGGGTGGTGGYSVLRVPASGAGGGGCKIICTKLYELGLMDKDIYLADQAFGAKLLETNPDIYTGYRAWAVIVVDWMSGQGPKMMPWMSEEEFSAAARNWSISWAQDIATPWAEEMAFVMGKKEKGSLTGKMITAAGIPICKAVGVWQRWFGPSKTAPGFGKGLALIAIFIMFKLVSELGKVISKCIGE